MKKLLFFYILILCIACSDYQLTIPSKINPEIALIKTFGGSNTEIAQSVVKTSDGGYAITGYTLSNNNDFSNKTTTDADYFILKFSSDDVLEWNKIYGGTNDDRASDIIQTSDGGFAILGYSKSSDGNVTENFGAQDFWMTKLNANGNLEWQKSFGFVGRDIGTTLIQTADDGYLISGELDVTASGGQGNSSRSTIASRHAGGDYWAIKISSSGTKEWSKYFGGNFTDTPYGVVQTTDGGYIIAGTSDSSDTNISNNLGTYDFWVVRISVTGTLIWEKNFGGSEIDEARDIIETNDGNFIIVGDTRSSDKKVSKNNGGADLWVVKINIDGELLWEKNFGGSSFDVARSINKASDGGFIISGSSRSLDNGFTNQGQNDAWLLKISSNGEKEWQKFIGGSEIDVFYDAVELNSGNIIAVGESSSNNGNINQNKGFSDLLIAKIK